MYQHNICLVFDLDTDSNGRWSVERFKGPNVQVEREANVISSKNEKRKKPYHLFNDVICFTNGVLDYAPALNNNLNVDDTGNTFGVY